MMLSHCEITGHGQSPPLDRCVSTPSCMGRNDPVAAEHRSAFAICLDVPADDSDEAIMAHAVNALYQALEARDEYTAGHSARVGRYAEQIAAELGLSLDAQREIRLAGQMHDVGKIGVSDELLRKEGPLTPDEYRQILEHTLIGERMLHPLLGARPVVIAVARWHHERFNGSGFPDRLVGEEIPLPARIVAVADAFDAMRSTRSYRDALPWKVATWELANAAGRQFDPNCVAAFLAVLGRERGAARRVERHRSRRPPRRLEFSLAHWSVTVEPWNGGHADTDDAVPELRVEESDRWSGREGPTGFG